MNAKEIKAEITDILRSQAYDRGHSSGEVEVQGLLDDLMWDFKDVFTMLDNMSETTEDANS